ncbi:MAG: vitamin B12-dependent ribonucleotide reductase, partial [Deltaproteobacteria bacterium]|nr:vitamin B12-dependent ribonucleotide reductase [Deltaproteobacteria bacterium]
MKDIKEKKGLAFSRRFTDGKTPPMDMVEWEQRVAAITAEDGTDVFRQDDVEFPVFYSQSATNVIASKYFRGTLGTANRENSVRDMILRVTDTLAGWGRKNGYFSDDESAGAFHDELTWLVVNQYGTFNSPVWFNVGVEKKPQCSACF